MRVSRVKAAENRERIVDTAARLFREKGFEGVGIDAIMKEAGLTHGGFYGHFGSKEDLVAEAVVRALTRSAEELARFTDLGDLAGAYLSEHHLADRVTGCAVAAWSSDLCRQNEGVRRGLTAHLRAKIDHFAALVREGGKAERRRRAIATLAGLLGALTLARAVEEPDLAKEILAAARAEFGKKRPAARRKSQATATRRSRAAPNSARAATP